MRGTGRERLMLTNYRFNWAPIWDARDLIASGLMMTIALSLVALAFSIVIGLVVGSAGASGPPGAALARPCSSIRCATSRCSIHMYVWYMALAFLKLPAFGCAVLGLSLYSGAYVAGGCAGGDWCGAARPDAGRARDRPDAFPGHASRCLSPGAAHDRAVAGESFLRS